METSNQQFISRDAVNRFVRSLWQGLGIDMAVAIVLAFGTYFLSADGWGSVEWAVISFSVAKSVVQAIVSYVMRKYVDTSTRLQNSGVPTPPLPPAVTGE